MASQKFFHVLIDFKTKKKITGRPVLGSSTLKDKCSKKSSDCFIIYDYNIIIYQSNQCKMNASAKISNFR